MIHNMMVTLVLSDTCAVDGNDNLIFEITKTNWTDRIDTNKNLMTTHGRHRNR